MRGADGPYDGPMPRVESSIEIDVPVEDAFALAMSQREVRYEWDPFVREQRLLHGAAVPARGVQSLTRSRHRLVMVSEYTSFKPPTQVGMKVVKGPPFFANFGGGWSFKPLDGGRTLATWRYTFSIRPGWLAPVADPLGTWVLGRDIDKRLQEFARGCENPGLVERAHAQLSGKEFP